MLAPGAKVNDTASLSFQELVVNTGWNNGTALPLKFRNSMNS